MRRGESPLRGGDNLGLSLVRYKRLPEARVKPPSRLANASVDAVPGRRSVMSGLFALLGEIADYARHQAGPHGACTHKRRDLVRPHLSPADNSNRCVQLVVDHLYLLGGLQEPIWCLCGVKTR